MHMCLWQQAVGQGLSLAACSSSEPSFLFCLSLNSLEELALSDNVAASSSCGMPDSVPQVHAATLTRHHFTAVL
jgi:hypothetical protein